MRGLAFAVVVACGSPAKPVPTVAPLANLGKTCAEAAVGIERGTKSVRPPESSVVQDMKQRCADDAWPEPARACFADMHEDELGKCAAQLADAPRKAMFAALAGQSDDRTAIAIARARL